MQPVTSSRRIRQRLADPVLLVALVLQSLVLGGSAIAAVTLTGADVRDDSITSADLRNLGVSGVDLANNSIGSSKIRNGSIHGADIADGKVGRADLADGIVNGSKLAAGAVSGNALAPGAVTGAALAPNAVDASKLAEGSVTLDALAPSARPSDAVGSFTVVAADAPSADLGTVGDFEFTGDCATSGGSAAATITIARTDGSPAWGMAGSRVYGPGATPPPGGIPVESIYLGGSVTQTLTVDFNDQSFARYDVFLGPADPAAPSILFARLTLIRNVAGSCLLAHTIEPLEPQ